MNDESRDDPAYRALAAVFRQRASRILEDVRSQGLRDPEIEVFFSRSNWRKNPERCIEDAESALRLQPISAAARRSALYNLASSHVDQGRYRQALPYLEELMQIERSEITMMLLALCRQQEGNLAEAVRLANSAILDSPDRADLHIHLASIYQKLGKPGDAENHLQMARLLRLRVPQLE